MEWSGVGVDIIFSNSITASCREGAMLDGCLWGAEYRIVPYRTVSYHALVWLWEEHHREGSESSTISRDVRGHKIGSQNRN